MHYNNNVNVKICKTSPFSSAPNLWKLYEAEASLRQGFLVLDCSTQPLHERKKQRGHYGYQEQPCH